LGCPVFIGWTHPFFLPGQGRLSHPHRR
jgi:hypothetical protein